MKTIYFKSILILVFTLLFSCENRSDLQIIEDGNVNLITQFVYSSDFQELVNSNSYINIIGEVDLKKSSIQKIFVDSDYYSLLTICLTNDNKITGQVIGLKLIHGRKKLKTDHDYVMAYRDFSEFDFKSKSGFIIDYDLNYDSYMCGSLSVSNNSINDINVFEMPFNVKEKYSFKQRSSKDVHPCDSSEDGDVSFGECYKCFKEAIASDGVVEFICDIVDFYCYGSIAVSCIILSSNN